MPSLAPQARSQKPKKRKPKQKVSFAESQRLAKIKIAEKKAHKTKVKLEDLAIFTQQLSSMLEAGLPLVSALEALQEQTANLYFQVIIKAVRIDVASGTSFSDATRKFPKAFPKLFISMAEAGEASGNLGDILNKTATYFEDSVKLAKKVKSAMVYPIAVILFAIVLVNILLVFVIPVFADMFSSFGADLPKPTLLLIWASDFLKKYILFIILGAVGLWKGMNVAFATPKGRVVKDFLAIRAPIFGNLVKKISLSRFCRTFAILMKSGVPILQALEIVSSGADNTYIEKACADVSTTVSQGGQISEVLAVNTYFPSMINHMVKAGEQTGDVDTMMVKVSDFYDVEIDNTVSALTSLLEPLLIIFLGIIIGGIVMAMFMPILKMSTIM